jgi:UDP-2,4-diacetamido-2,4,6-trideoxy-beta-L-altropyranose hydrolase
MSKMLIFRADASAQIGTGHVMRCFALAQEWRRVGGRASFVCAEITPALEVLLDAEGIFLHRLSVKPGTDEDAEQTNHYIRSLQSFDPVPWIVLDGYEFNAGFQRAIKLTGVRMLCVDDYGQAEHYYADYVLNQNLSAREEWFRNRETYTCLLLGTSYALLRQQFLAFRSWERAISPIARNILVTLGGSDPENVSAKIIEALFGLNVAVKVVIGGSNPHLQKLRAQVSSFNERLKISMAGAGCQGTVELIVDTREMPEMMAWADVAIAAGGSTSWELAFMGLPAIVLVLADNQKDVARRLDEEGVSVNLGLHTSVEKDQITVTLQSLLADKLHREKMSGNGRRLVDGEGVARVVTRMRAAEVTLRRVRVQDCRLIWEWANDPAVRASAFSSEKIPLESHESWFAAKLASPTTAFFIAVSSGGHPFGQIRFDWDEESRAEIDVSVSGDVRQSGMGSALIRAGVDEMLRETQLQVFHAYIKESNASSRRAFERAGFRCAERLSVRGFETCHLILKRNND